MSLCSLVAIPAVVARQTNMMRREISNLAEPARRAANQIQMDLAQELDRIIAFQVTGQTQYRDEYFALLGREERNRVALRELSRRLGGGLEDDLNAVMVHAGRWHEGVRQGELLARQLPAEVWTTRMFERHAAYTKALGAASELELAMQGAIDDRLQRMRSADQWSRWLTLVLTLLALTSALLVAGLGRQMRLLAREAVRRRQDAEREAIESRNARAAAEREERRSAFLAAAGQQLATTLDYDQTIGMLAQLVVSNLAELAVVDLVDSDGTLRRVASAHRDPELESSLAEEHGRVRTNMPEPVVRIMQEREARLIGSSRSLIEYAGGGSEGNRTMIAAPLVTRGEAFGVLIALAKESKPFTAGDLPLFTELSRHAALAIDNARLYLESQQAVRAREEVLAVVSHDLRNPLNAVMLAAQLTETSPALAEEDREQIETISVSARRMSRLIADLLDVTRLEGGKRLPIEPGPVTVASLFEESEELFKAQASAASVTLQMRGSQAVVHADRDRIMQVLSNVIGNALKFTPAGGMITVRAGEPESGEVQFQVSDTGPGIPREHLDHVFDPYWQAKRTERMGAGLGLPIAMGIVDAHGGRIWAESEPGKGTTFRFTLPVDADQARGGISNSSLTLSSANN
ncbi:MAG TPA: HAMP domain-containing sensor histidine kinase [Thermoanaerobaculia bacterium]|nr:HAMP domain-containing sensor histidine kinase [Thermoanaerobaculia bacterium]